MKGQLQIPLKKSNGIQTIFYLFYHLLNLQCIRFQNDKTHSKKSYNFWCKSVSHRLRTLTLLSKFFVYLIGFQNRLIATLWITTCCDRVQEKVYNGRYCYPLNLVELSLQFFLCLSNMFLKNLGLPMTSSISDIYSKVGCRLIDTNFLTI